MPYRQRRIHGDIGRAIHRIRRRLNLSQTELATLCGCDQSTINRYQTGKCEIGLKILIRFLRLAKGPREQLPFLKRWEAFDIDASDLHFLLSLHTNSPTNTLCASPTQEAMSEQQVCLDIPQDGAAEETVPNCPDCGCQMARYAGPGQGERGFICLSPGCYEDAQ